MLAALRCSTGGAALGGWCSISTTRQRSSETVGNATAKCLPCTNGNCHPRGLHSCTQTPWVVFSNGLQRLAGKDEFVVWYGAGDTSVMAASIRVKIPIVKSD